MQIYANFCSSVKRDQGGESGAEDTLAADFTGMFFGYEVIVPFTMVMVISRTPTVP